MHGQLCNAVIVDDVLPFARILVLQHSIRIFFCKKLSVCPEFIFTPIICNPELFSRAVVAPPHFLLGDRTLPSSNKLLCPEWLVQRISPALDNICLHRAQRRLTIQVLRRYTTGERKAQHRADKDVDCRSTWTNPHHSLIFVSMPSQTTRPVLRSYNAKRSL